MPADDFVLPIGNRDVQMGTVNGDRPCDGNDLEMAIVFCVNIPVCQPQSCMGEAPDTAQNTPGFDFP